MLHGCVVLTSLSGGSLPILKREFTIWDKSIDDPDSNGMPKKVDSRLVSGQHMFPFSFPFPTQIDPISDPNSISPFHPNTVGTVLSAPPSPTTPDGQKSSEKPQRRTRRTSASDESPSSSKRSEALGHPHTSLESEPRRRFASSMPQTFMEKDIDVNITYDISVRIVHGRFKTSSKIKTNIACIPASEPLPASQKRREAYEAGALVPCPMDDPEGWFALPTVKIYGMVKIEDNLVHTRVDCTLYIAQPLSYTRGSLIPCFITIHSDDVEVAHLLPSTENPPVRLLRRIWHPHANFERPSPGFSHSGPIFSNTTWAHVMVTSEMNLVTHEVGRANWWIPLKDVVQSPNVRQLEGEIHLSPDLQPSCDFQLFRIEYAVELLSFQTANFKPDTDLPSPGLLRKGDNVIASNPVEITTVHRQDEPVPTAYSEPPKIYRKRRMTSAKDVIFENDK